MSSETLLDPETISTSAVRISDFEVENPRIMKGENDVLEEILDKENDINLSESQRVRLEHILVETLNSGSLKQLKQLITIGQKRADTIIEHRTTRPLKELNDLKFYGCGFTPNFIHTLLVKNVQLLVQNEIEHQNISISPAALP